MSSTAASTTAEPKVAGPIRRIGFIGLGTMGAPMARNLLRAGFRLSAFDIDPAAIAALDTAEPARSAADAARDADCVITMLPNGEHVEEALFGPAGAAPALAPGSLAIEMSTIAPAVTDRVARRLAERGIAMLDAPVGRSSQHAVAGKLLIMVGGAAEDLARARPILEALGDTIVHCGASGRGSRMKIVNNYMSATLNVTTAEALALAEASGLDPELARQVMLSTVAGQGHMGTTYPAKVLKGDLSPGFMIDLAIKDLRLALDLGRSAGAALATGTVARDAYEEASRQGRGREDWTALYALAREKLGGGGAAPREARPRAFFSLCNGGGGTMMPRRGADLVMDCLEAAGIDTIFTLSGNHIMALFDAAVGRAVRLVHVRHEGAAVHMADAWARLSGKVGVALVTGGPGHANAVGALFTARAAETPLLLLSGHAPLNQYGSGAFQELDQPAVVRLIVKEAGTVRTASALGSEIARAIRIASSGRPGPVHLSLPVDLLEGPLAVSCDPPPTASFSAEPMPLSPTLAADAVRLLRAAERPIVIAPPALCTPRGRLALGRLERSLGVPVVAMESPRGLADPALGAFGEVLARADRIALLGKALDFTLRFGDAPAIGPDAEWLILEPDPALLARAVARTRERAVLQALAGPAESAASLTAAAAREEAPARMQTWASAVRAAIEKRSEPGKNGALTSASLTAALADALAPDPQAIFISDGGEIGQWAQATISTPNRIINGVAGAIGSAIPFAIGARAAAPQARVFAVLGDGTFGFHMAEFDTAVRHDLPFIAVVGNDGRWNAEYQIQLRQYGADRARGCLLAPSARYDKVAAALGGHGERVTRLADLAPALSRAAASGKPACVEVQIEGLPAPAPPKRP